MKKMWNRVIAVMLVLCMALSMTAVAADSSAAQNPVGGMQNTAAVSEENTGKVMMLKLNETQAYLNGSMIPTLVYGSGYVSKLIMVNGSTLLPLRFVCECLGFEVGYNEQTNNSTITDTANGVRFELVTGTTEMYKYDLEGNLLASGTATAPTTIIEGVTHVPVRSLLEAMGFYVYWDDEGYVLISETPKTAEEFRSLIDSWGQIGDDSEYPDTDNDGIPDMFETDLFHTDPNHPDTDGDGLPDGYEVYPLSTDPLKQDSDDNGVLDGAEDADDDGLTNSEEFTLGTGPLSPDTDEDGLTDSEEIDTYHTDPLNADSDEDNINDGDEISMGLNPLNPQTFGILDSQYTFTQSITSAKLEDINTDNFYELKIEIQAAGNANTSLNVNESLSSANDAIFGKPVELSYDENLNFDEMTMNFVLNTDFIGAPTGLYDDPGLEGIQRFQIFRFDEAAGSLCPVETSYDTVNNTLSATVEELGDYMLIDLDLWMYTLGIVPEDGMPALVMSEPMQTKSVSIIDSMSPFSDSELSAYYDNIVNKQIENTLKKSFKSVNNTSGIDLQKYNKQIDLVFAINVGPSTDNITGTVEYWDIIAGEVYDPRSGVTGIPLEHLKASIVRTVSKLYYQKGISANVCIISFGGTDDCVIHKLNGSEWVKTPEQVSQILSNIGISPVGARHLDTIETIMNLPFRENVPKFLILISNNELNPSSNSCGKTTQEIKDELVAMNIIPMVVAEANVYTSLRPLTEGIMGFSCNALAFDIDFASSPTVLWQLASVNFIDYLLQNQLYTYIGANDLCVRVLETPITKNGPADSDGDSLTDWQETDREALEFFAQTPYNDGDVITDLPTFAQYMHYSNFYISNQFSRLKQHYSDELANLIVLPIVSDPMSVDGDGDWIRDNLDPKPLKGDPNNISSDLSSDLIGQLQDWLVSLGYLDMLDNPYGVSYGVLTHTAVNLYRLNHGMALTEEKTLDRETFALIANDYFNRFDDGQSRYYSILPNSAAAYRSYVPHIKPTLSKEYADLGIKVTLMSNKDIKSDCNRYGVSVPEKNLYFYDYTTPITEVLVEKAYTSIELTSKFGNSDLGNTALVIWWMSKVYHGKEWDVKLDYNWKKMFPEIKYYAQRFPFVFNQKVLNSEDLGNVIYGYLGYAVGFSDWELYRGSEFAAALKGVSDTPEDKANMLWGMLLYCEQNNIPFLPTITN